jgi:hypothetical protein
VSKEKLGKEKGKCEGHEGCAGCVSEITLPSDIATGQN